MVRLFTAFPIDDIIAKDFLEIAEQNKNAEGVRWTIRQNLHVTLFFIGEVENEHVEKIAGIIQNEFSEIKKINLCFERIEVKLKKFKPSMIWARFAKDEEFSSLSKQIEESVKDFMTIEPQHKDPIPHCTLARMKPTASIDKLNLTFAKNFEIEVDHVELWKSVQSKTGVVYQKQF